MSDKRLFSVKEAAEYLSIPVGSLYNMVYRRQVEVVKIGRLVRFDRAYLDAFIEKRRVAVINEILVDKNGKIK
jgi:excisionase family DNA binding protein